MRDGYRIGTGRLGTGYLFDTVISLPGYSYSLCTMLQRKLECTADVAHVMMSSF